MFELLLKGVISGTLVVVATEASKRSTVMGAILVSLPLVSILALIWLWRDTHDIEQVIDLSWAVALIVAPSIVLFIALPILLHHGVSFWPSMAISIVALVVAYAAYTSALTRFTSIKL